jgi:hypothetical protein
MSVRVFQVEILHAQSKRFQQAKAAAVEQARNHPVRTPKRAEQSANFGAGEDHRQALWAMCPRDIADPWQIDPQHVLEQKEEGGKCLRLRRSRHVTVYGQVGEESFDATVAEVSRTLSIVKFDESGDPADILFLRAVTIVALAYFGSDLVQKVRLASMLHKHSAAFDDKAACVLYLNQ